MWLLLLLLLLLLLMWPADRLDPKPNVTGARGANDSKQTSNARDGDWKQGSEGDKRQQER